MDAREIKELLNFVRKADFDEFELELEGFRLRVVKNKAAGAGQVVMTTLPPTMPAMTAIPAAVPAAVSPVAPAAPIEEAPKEKLHEISSPMVGTFYRATSPGAKPFASVGDHITVGQTLCIIEAMKLMNEIESDVSGVVVEVVPENAQPVEYGETLFRIRADK